MRNDQNSLARDIIAETLTTSTTTLDPNAFRDGYADGFDSVQLTAANVVKLGRDYVRGFRSGRKLAGAIAANAARIGIRILLALALLSTLTLHADATPRSHGSHHSHSSHGHRSHSSHSRRHR
jgi:hypothetical protein